MSATESTPLNGDARYNYWLHLLSLSLTKLGDALTSSRLVLAWILASLGAPAIALSLLVPIRESLALLPQLAIARQLHRYRRRKGFWVLGSLGQASALLIMAVALLTLPAGAASWAIIAALALFSLSRGICSIAIKEVMGRVVPKHYRGRLSGTAASIAGVITLATAAALWIAPKSLKNDSVTFAAILVVAALLWAVAAVVYSQIREQPTAPDADSKNPSGFFAELTEVLRERDFRRFLVARMLLVATAFSIPYIVIEVQKAGANAVLGLAALLAAEGFSGLLSGRLWGIWSDSAAHRVMAVAAILSVVTLGATLSASASGAVLAHPLVSAGLIFMAATAHHGVRIGRSTYLIDLANDSNRARYTAVGNTVMGLFLLSGGALGMVDEWLGTQAVIVVLMALGTTAALASLRLKPV